MTDWFWINFSLGGTCSVVACLWSCRSGDVLDSTCNLSDLRVLCFWISFSDSSWLFSAFPFSFELDLTTGFSLGVFSGVEELGMEVLIISVEVSFSA